MKQLTAHYFSFSDAHIWNFIIAALKVSCTKSNMVSIKAQLSLMINVFNQFQLKPALKGLTQANVVQFSLGKLLCYLPKFEDQGLSCIYHVYDNRITEPSPRVIRTPTPTHTYIQLKFAESRQFHSFSELTDIFKKLMYKTPWTG